MDLVAASLGFVVGIIATAFATEFGLKKLFAPPETTKLTSAWRLSELREPLIATSGPLPERLPAGTRVLVADAVDASRWPGVTIRRSPEVRGNFAVEGSGDKALLLTGGLAAGSLGVVTVDGATVQALRQEFARLWGRAEVHVEELPLREVAGKLGLNVRTQGVVEEVIEGREAWILRLSDAGATVGVLVDAPLHEAVGRRIAVTGRIVKGTSGYPVLDARGGVLPRAAAPAGPHAKDAPGERPTAAPVRRA